VKDHIKLDRTESDALITCLMKAADAGRRTGNLELPAMAVYLVDLTIDKWMPEGDGDD
jgi:hypothetical protein